MAQPRTRRTIELVVPMLNLAWRLICVADVSRDRSRPLLSDLAHRHDNVRVWGYPG